MLWGDADHLQGNVKILLFIAIVQVTAYNVPCIMFVCGIKSSARRDDTFCKIFVKPQWLTTHNLGKE